MKTVLSALLVTLLTLNVATAQQPCDLLPSHSPSKVQQQLMKRQYGMFIHFGINTFNGQEWSDGTTPASAYCPTDLDCDQWVRVARDAGFRYVLLITKHHDGFCLWDSKYTDYDVASSPVKTDVVAEVSKACKKYGLEFAIYYSLWDRHDPSYRSDNFNDYIDYMEGQLTELLTGYGDVCEVWFDGGWDKQPEEWQLPRIYRHIKRLQPDCAVGVNHTIVMEEGKRDFTIPDLMTEDDRYYFQYFPSDFRLWDPKIAHRNDKKQYLHEGQSYYLPFEHTICISNVWNWFQKDALIPVRDLDELEELFYWCTDNGNTLVINIPPDRTGRIRETEANAVIALNQRLGGLRKGKPLPTNGRFLSTGQPVESSSSVSGHEAAAAVDGGMQTYWEAAPDDPIPTLTVSLDGPQRFNKISIFEHCDVENSSDGFSNVRTNRIRKYAIDILQDNGSWLNVYYGDRPMGDCKVVNFPKTYTASQVRLRIIETTAAPAIYEFNIINK